MVKYCIKCIKEATYYTHEKDKQYCDSHRTEKAYYQGATCSMENCRNKAMAGLRGCKLSVCTDHMDKSIFLFQTCVGCHYPYCTRKRFAGSKFCKEDQNNPLPKYYLDKVKEILIDKKLSIFPSDKAAFKERPEVLEICTQVISILLNRDSQFPKSSSKTFEMIEEFKFAEDNPDKDFINEIIKKIKDPEFLEKLNSKLGDVEIYL